MIIIILFPHRGFSRIIYDIFIFDQIVFRLSLGSHEGSVDIENYIYHGVSPYFSHWVFKEFYQIHIYTLVFFPQGFFQSFQEYD
jgi:hypothetical protein